MIQAARRSIRARNLVLSVFGLAALAALAPASAATFQIYSFSASPSTTQAGGHPDVVFSYADETSIQTPTACGCNNARDVTVRLPAGLITNIHATPQCTSAEFGTNSCSPDSQVGYVLAKACLTETFCIHIPLPLYNLVPPSGQAGVLAFKTPLIESPIYTVFSARTGSDYGLDAKVEELERLISIPEFEQVTWGIPADPANNSMRYFSGPPGLAETGAASTSPPIPFLQNPTTCGEALSSSLEITAYDETSASAESPWPATSGCQQLSFNPALSAEPTTTATDTPSGLEVDLTVPQFESPTTPSPSEIRATTVKLPEGFSINSAAADGKSACSEAQAGTGPYAEAAEGEEAHCPEFSKVGTVSIDSAALPAPIPGYLYLGEPQPGNRYRVFLVANGFGTHVKLAGNVSADPRSGRLTISFPNLPQAPFSEFNLHIFGAERGLLATPTRCGTYEVDSTFTPWDGELPEHTATQFFTIDAGPGGSEAECPSSSRPFAPGFKAASAGNAAAIHSPFSIELTRPDGDQNLTGLTISTPPGLLATLKGIPYCPPAAIEAARAPGYSGLAEESSPSCPAASEVGVSTAGAGAGGHPVYLPGRVYLAGPYRGAPLSLAVITPAVSGPYDLGNVVVRVALRVDPETAQVTAVSDPLPQILEGIPLRLRSIRLDLNREGFVLNPTDCKPLSVNATISGDEGAVATPSAYFQVANCSILPFAPKLGLKLGGGLNRLGHPAIHASLTTKPGEANPRSVTVTLPRGELLDNSHIQSVCSTADFAAERCPAGSLVGHAEVSSPLLEAPLAGPIYLRTSGKGLPDLALDLNGQIHFVALAQVDSVHEAYRASFNAIPDVPLGRVTLDLLGGHKGLLQNSESLCGTHKSASVAMVAQSGRSLGARVPLGLACGGKGRNKRHARAGSGRGAR